MGGGRGGPTRRSRLGDDGSEDWRARRRYDEHITTCLLASSSIILLGTMAGVTAALVGMGVAMAACISWMAAIQALFLLPFTALAACFAGFCAFADALYAVTMAYMVMVGTMLIVMLPIALEVERRGKGGGSGGQGKGPDCSSPPLPSLPSTQNCSGSIPAIPWATESPSPLMQEQGLTLSTVGAVGAASVAVIKDVANAVFAGGITVSSSTSFPLQAPSSPDGDGTVSQRPLGEGGALGMPILQQQIPSRGLDASLSSFSGTAVVAATAVAGVAWPNGDFMAAAGQRLGRAVSEATVTLTESMAEASKGLGVMAIMAMVLGAVSTA